MTPIKYGVFTCLTDLAQVYNTYEMKLRVGTGLAETFYGCGNSDADRCNYQQLDEDTPTITSVVVYSPTQIKFKGTGFPIGYNG